MKSKTRADLLKALQELSNRYPDLRFGQLLVNVSNWVGEPTPDSLWHVEDQALLAAARQHLEELAARETAPASSATPA